MKKIKSTLEEKKWLDKSQKISCDPQTQMFKIPVRIEKQKEIGEVEGYLKSVFSDDEFYLEEAEGDVTEKRSEKDGLQGQLTTLLESLGIEQVQIARLVQDLPKRYSIYPPLLLLPHKTLDSEIWKTTLGGLPKAKGNEILQLILKFHSTPSNHLTHLAINNPIPESQNVIRSPTQLTVLYGDFEDFWCHSVQNGIYQTWMPLHTMFSRGNIKEKARILRNYQDIDETTDVVDLYAGIGYFTLSYLKKHAKRVFCWEINQYSVEGLARGVKKNGFGDAYVVQRDQKVDLKRVLMSRCVVFLESNQHCLERFKELLEQEEPGSESELKLNVSHVNLGLLPTSTASWPFACKLVDFYGSKNSCSWIHVHENIGVSDLDSFMKDTQQQLQSFSQTKHVEPIWLEKVKTFAPDVYHVVGDFKLNQ